MSGTLRDVPGEWLEALAAWEAAQQSGGAPAATIRKRAAHVRHFARTTGRRDPFAVTTAQLAAWLALHQREPATAKNYRATFRAFYAWAVETGRCRTNPGLGLTAARSLDASDGRRPVERRMGVTGPVPRDLPPAWEEAIREWRAAQHDDGRPASTVQKGTKHLRHVATTTEGADPFALSAADLAAWFRAQPWADTTAAAYRTTMRNFYAWALQTGRTLDDPAVYLSRVRTGPVTALGRPLGASGPLPEPVPEAWEGPLRLFARELRAMGHSPQTVNLRTALLSRLARGLHPLTPFTVTHYDLLDWMAGHTWSVETRRSMRSTLRTFYAWALEAGHTTTDPAAKLPKTGVGRPNPHPASEEAVWFAILCAEPRERLMVRLGAEIGLRRSEIAQVHSRDLLEQDGGWSLLVHGKGARDRLLPLPDALAAELRMLPPGWAFPSPRGGHLNAAHVGKLMSALLPEGTAAHALRHRFATRAYELQADILVVQELLGHASPVTTRRYVEVNSERLRSTVATLAATTTRRAALAPAATRA